MGNKSFSEKQKCNAKADGTLLQINYRLQEVQFTNQRRLKVVVSQAIEEVL